MKDWITIDETLRRFGLSRATLYRLIASRKVTRAKRAGDVRAYVSAAEVRQATSLRPTPPVRKKGEQLSSRRAGERRRAPPSRET